MVYALHLTFDSGNVTEHLTGKQIRAVIVGGCITIGWNRQMTIKRDRLRKKNFSLQLDIDEVKINQEIWKFNACI